MTRFVKLRWLLWVVVDSFVLSPLRSLYYHLIESECPGYRYSVASPCSSSATLPVPLAVSSNRAEEAWINEMLDQAWHSAISVYLSTHISVFLEKWMAEKTTKSTFIKNAKVKRVILGSQAPKVLEVRVLEKVDSSIHCEVKFEWVTQGFLAVLELASNSALTNLTAQLTFSELVCSGSAHCVLGPLVAGMPPAKLLSVFFMQDSKPQIDLKVSLVGNSNFGTGGNVEVTATLGKLLIKRLRNALVFPNTAHCVLNSSFPTAAAAV